MQQGQLRQENLEARAPQDRVANNMRDLRLTRVLIKYLEHNDPLLHQVAKNIIRDCAERHQRQQPGYENLTFTVNQQLKLLVGDHYWIRAEAYLQFFLDNYRNDIPELIQEDE